MKKFIAKSDESYEKKFIAKSDESYEKSLQQS